MTDAAGIVLDPTLGRASAPISLAGSTTLRVGGVAKDFFAPSSVPTLASLLRRLASCGRSPFFLGKGANTLFPDGDYDRPVVSMRQLRTSTVRGLRLRADAGVSLGRLISLAMHAGLSGLEGLVGIPATAGGAVMMNAGGHGGCFGERVRRLGLLPVGGGEVVEIEGRDVDWSYRSANLHGWVVAWVELELTGSNPPEVRARTQSLLAAKARTQPLAAASAGCIFRNPPGGSAGQLIEELGLKGLRRGAAEVSHTHANFIVNVDQQATARDVLELVGEVRRRVESRRGVRLETELVCAAEEGKHRGETQETSRTHEP